MKRGLRCDFVHSSGRPFTGAESAYKAYAQTARLDRFQGGSRLFIVPFGRAQRQIAAAGAGGCRCAQRRLMVRVASTLGLQEGAERSSRAIRSARSRREPPQPGGRRGRCSAPLLRPLVAWDKAEIVREAEELGTLEVATLPAEDCCTLFASPLAETRAEPEKLARLEASLGLDAAVEGLVAAAELVRPRLERPSRQLVPGG